MDIDRPHFERIKENTLYGRYITADHIESALQKMASVFRVEEVGRSVLGQPIHSIEVGRGKTKVLLWSQMHGNETTTTKAVFDLLNDLAGEGNTAVLDHCTLKIIPILNPDGAKAYTRANANGIDLNRDARELTQPESRVLREVYHDFRPDWCFNLHGQRTIFNVGTTPKPATISFLAPAFNSDRGLSASRELSMKAIVAMKRELDKWIPGGVGRYDDAFNPNCVGDTFQMLQTPTILFEAGHYPGDYQREETRFLIYVAFRCILDVLTRDSIGGFSIDGYFQIPENGKKYYDIVIKNVQKAAPHFQGNMSVGILFRETLRGGSIIFEPQIEKVGDLEGYFGHETFDLSLYDDYEQIKGRQELQSLLKKHAE